jgi:hypothetical protein
MKSMLIFNGVSSILALSSAIMLYATYLGKPEAKWSIYFAAANCLVISIHQAVNFFFAVELKKRFGRGPGPKSQLLDPTPNSRKPSLKSVDTGELINAPSVTEQTTELLEGQRPRDPRVSN